MTRRSGGAHLARGQGPSLTMILGHRPECYARELARPVVVRGIGDDRHRQYGDCSCHAARGRQGCGAVTDG